ncbi:MAG TPA: peptide chain release factor-like protein, partial [Dehalococcoidia bacterium]|nr:peptide chain release factor-like protein [Dehalococcoidia bacterium]
LAECEVDTHRGSGPGGQKRNKTESAVRLRHKPSGLIVIAEESRSQAENRVRALKRLRRALALRLRSPVDPDGMPEAVSACIDKTGRLRVGRRDARYLPAAASVLDLLLALQGSVAETARRVGITTGNLSAFLTGDPELLAEANRIRASLGFKPLRDN